MNVSFPISPSPSAPAALHQQVQFQSHFHVTAATTTARESRALERRKKSTEGPNLHIGFGVAFAEERKVESEAEPTAKGAWSASPRPNVK